MTDREKCRKILSNLTQVRFSRRVDFFDVLGDLARCVIRIGNRSIVQRRSFMVTHSPRFEIHNRPIWEIDDSFAGVSRRCHARQTGGFQSEDCTTGCILTLILFGCTTSRTVDTQQTECTHHFFGNTSHEFNFRLGRCRARRKHGHHTWTFCLCYCPPCLSTCPTIRSNHSNRDTHG